MPYQIRDVDVRSIAAVHDMNEQALPHVNSVTRDYFHARIDSGSYFRAVYHGEAPVAFLLAMSEAADYDSLNFLWFRDRYPRFIYIDRIVVDPGHRQGGLGLMLYDDLDRWVGTRFPILACEVNLRPPNEPSLRFHEKLGFEPVGTQETDGGRKTVSLMTRPVVPALELEVLAAPMTIARLAPGDDVPEWIEPESWHSVTRTGEELSVVCESRLVPPGVRRTKAWRALKVAGPLDFSLTGILVRIAGPLADAGISIFSVSTYDTDYVLVPEEDLGRAVEGLRAAGLVVRAPV